MYKKVNVVMLPTNEKANIDMSKRVKLKNESTNDTKPVLDEVSFNVTTYQTVNKNVIYYHWSKELSMIIEKNGVTIKLNSEEIEQVVKSLPRTVGGRY